MVALFSCSSVSFPQKGIICFFSFAYVLNKIIKPKYKTSFSELVNSNLGGVFTGPFWGGKAGGGITPCLKLVRIMLEAWNLVCNVRAHIYLVSEKIAFIIKVLLILLMSAFIFFFGKNQHFLPIILSLFKAILWELC